MGGAFQALVARDLRLAYRRWGDYLSPLMFYAVVSTLFPLAISPQLSILREIGAGALWVGALLATLLSLNSLFRNDFEDGSMEQLVLSAHPLPLLVFAKVVAHWLVSGLPLVLIAPALATSYDLSGEGIRVLGLALLLGTPALSLIGSVGAALTAGLRQASGLLALLVLPLMMPVLIFGARATDMAQNGLDPSGPLFLLAALSMLSLSLTPFAAAAALRITVD
jgi:heme exporter protein B